MSSKIETINKKLLDMGLTIEQTERVQEIIDSVESKTFKEGLIMTLLVGLFIMVTVT